MVVGFLFSLLGACGGHKSSGTSPFPGRIILTPGTSASLQLGGTLTFTASAQNSSGTSVTTTFTFQSSDTNILNLAPNGVACAGVWDASFVNCTPQNYGPVQVTASALGATSVPTIVYVHPPVDNVQISFICPPTPAAPACPGPQTLPLACISDPPATQFPACSSSQPNPQPPPCLSANQSMTLQANAFSKGVDVTTSVGPFAWSETSSSVIAVVPLITDTNTNIATNQATVTPNAPGFTAIYATASNVSSQPYYAETCPVQCVALELGNIGSGNTSFAVNKGTNETAVATAVDVQGCVVPKPPLTWTSTQPAAVTAGGGNVAGCAAGTACALTDKQPGAASVTASCIPPTCNIGFPQSVAGLPPGNLIQPVPVYPVTAISGLVSGAPASTTVLSTSLDCATNLYCNAYAYNVSTTTNVSGNPLQLPAPPNSLLFDPAGDKAYVGGNYGAVVVTPSSIGGMSSPFSDLSSVTGKVLAVSSSGNLAVFSDTMDTPNQVYVTNTSTSASGSVTALSISGATAAAFSPDGLKAFIIGTAGPNCSTSAPDCLFIYSPIQALQTIVLTAPATGVTFSATGAFAFINGGSAGSTIGIYNTCNNGLSNAPNIGTLPATPLFLYDLPAGNPPPPVTNAVSTPQGLPLGLDVLIGLDTTGVDLVATTDAQTGNSLPCPLSIATVYGPQHFDLGQGTFHPIAFFVSPDASTVYVVASDRSDILVYNFNTNTTSGIALISATGSPVSPVAATITVDGTLIYVAASDGELHEVSTTLGTDLMQIPFPNLPDVTNPFCSSGSTTVACNLNYVGVTQ
jgi:trimeric autotransporter adhesin